MQVTEAVNRLISESPFLEEAINENLINISSLSRKLKPEIEKILKRKVRTGAITMAINRRSPGSYLKISKGITSVLKNMGDITVRSGLSSYCYENSPSLVLCQRKLIDEIGYRKNIFFTFSQGVYETTIVAGNLPAGTIKRVFAGQKKLAFKKNLGSVTIQLPGENTRISGIYYFMLKNLAWKGINIVEIISATNEISIIVHESDVNRTFEIILEMKRPVTKSL